MRFISGADETDISAKIILLFPVNQSSLRVQEASLYEHIGA